MTTFAFKSPSAFFFPTAVTTRKEREERKKEKKKEKRKREKEKLDMQTAASRIYFSRASFIDLSQLPLKRILRYYFVTGAKEDLIEQLYITYHMLYVPARNRVIRMAV